MFAFFDQVILFLDQILEFISSGIYDFFTETFAQFIIYSTLASIKFKIFMLEFAWDTAQSIMQQLNISQAINTAFAQLNSNTLSFLTFYKLPECINIVLSAHVTRYVLSIIGL